MLHNLFAKASFALALFSALPAYAQEVADTTGDKNIQTLLLTVPLWKLSLDEIEVQATRADGRIPMAYSELNKDQIRANNLGVDLPILLDQTPSVVTNSDAGTGVGYTGLRIRGSDGTRINVTINGIPINDSESQGVFWVNMPDLASSAENIQIQRGAGTSTNGAGAFGASINIRTNAIRRKSYAEIGNSIGSFDTRRHSVAFGSGLLQNHFIIEGRLSQINSDGYIDRANSRLRAYSLTASYVDEKTILRFNTFAGSEKTYQAWGGVPISYIDSLPTYNPYTYENEVDDYTQTHYQLHATRYLKANITANVALHYTKGGGFYEQYRRGDRLSRYGLADVVLGDTTISSTDLIRRRWLDNDFYGAVYSFTRETTNLNIVVGGGWNNYVGAHFGEVIWAQYASNGNIRHKYYDNLGTKLDGNTYAKVAYTLRNRLTLFADLQHRFISYTFTGFDNDLQSVEQTARLHFFNPKLGATYEIDDDSRAFLSVSVANREPNRSDYTESTPNSRPKHETLYDLEAGYLRTKKGYSLSANYYFMYYNNQLVLNGQLNDVGAYIRSNVAQSYRTGIELQASAIAWSCVQVNANAAFSQNKVLNFNEYVDVWDDGSQELVVHNNTDIAFSPNVVAGAELMYFKQFRAEKRHAQRADIALIGKYVSRQYLDNTQSKARSLAGYFVQDIRLRYTLSNSFCERLDLTFLVRNAFNARYSPNGFVYRHRSDGYDPTPDDPYTQADPQAGYYNLIGLYPQAGINFMLGLNLIF